MNAQELFEAAAEVRPDLMEKTAAIISALEGEGLDVFSAGVLADIEGLTDHTMVKVAASPTAVWGAAVGGTLLSGLAASMATDLYDAAKRGLTKGRNFREIMKVNPELKGYDKTRLQNSYDALHRYAPEFTADPMLGGTLLKAVAEVPGNEHVIIKDLLSSRKNLQEAKHTQYRPGNVGIELETDADIQREIGQKAQQLRLAKRRESHERGMAERQYQNNLTLAGRRETHEHALEGTKRDHRFETQEHMHQLGLEKSDYEYDREPKKFDSGTSAAIQDIASKSREMSKMLAEIKAERRSMGYHGSGSGI